MLFATTSSFVTLATVFITSSLFQTAHALPTNITQRAASGAAQKLEPLGFFGTHPGKQYHDTQDLGRLSTVGDSSPPYLDGLRIAESLDSTVQYTRLSVQKAGLQAEKAQICLVYADKTEWRALNKVWVESATQSSGQTVRSRASAVASKGVSAPIKIGKIGPLSGNEMFFPRGSSDRKLKWKCFDFATIASDPRLKQNVNQCSVNYVKMASTWNVQNLPLRYRLPKLTSSDTKCIYLM